MIDVDTEELLTPSQGCRKFPPKGINRSTFDRYRLKGVGPQKIKLEVIRVGGLFYTSTEAIKRFIAQLNSEQPPQAAEVSPSRRKKQSEAAREALRKAGV